MSISSGWYLVQFKANSHKIALRNLARQGFSTFLPLEEVTRRRAGRFVTTLKPLFPGYLFVALDPDQGPWRQINSTFGVSRLVNVAGTPKQVPDHLVAALQERCDDDGLLLPPPTFDPGDNVELRGGPFAAFIATVEKMDADQRVWVLLEMMGQVTRIQVAADNLSVRPKDE